MIRQLVRRIGLELTPIMKSLFVTAQSRADTMGLRRYPNESRYL